MVADRPIKKQVAGIYSESIHILADLNSPTSLVVVCLSIGLLSFLKMCPKITFLYKGPGT